MIYTTLRRIKAHEPEASGWNKLLRQLRREKEDDTPVPIATILVLCGFKDALFCLRAEPQHNNIWRMLAVHYARQVQHLMKSEKAIKCLDIAWDYADGKATWDQLGFASFTANAEVGVYDWADRSALAAASVCGDKYYTEQYEATTMVSRAASFAEGAKARHAGGPAEGAAGAASRHLTLVEQARDLLTVLTHYNAQPGEHTT